MTTTRHLRGVLASPRVRKLAQTRGLDLTTLKGTGPGGRLLESDLVAPAPVVKAAQQAAPSVAAFAAVPVAGQGVSRREPMSGIELATSRHMSRCWATIPHVTLFREVDAARFEAQRQAAKQSFAKRDIKITVTAVLVKLVAAALRKHPRLNSSLDETANEIVYHGDINIGIGTDTPRGLVVPVIANADVKSLGTVATELNQLVETARAGRLRPEQMRGGTFTISNLGTAHSGFFTPIVNHPEVGILGVGASKPQNGSLVIPLSLSFDHRVINGADGAAFLQTIADGIDDPLTSLLV